jgi:hypothetical protein
VDQRRIPRRQLAVEGVWIFGVWLAGALVFFREQWDSGFKWLMGNDGDTRLAAYLTEHWFQVFHGQASWLSPSFFYPVKGTLGWSDTFFLFEIFYAPLRLLGADMFLALQITMILLSLVGFVTFVYLVRLGFGTPLFASLACGLIFTFSNALWIHDGSPQLSGIYVVPAILLLGLLAWRAGQAGHRVRAGILAGATGLLWALLLYSTYYVGWFSTLAVGVGVVLLLIVGRMSFIRQAVSEVRASWTWMACGIVGLVVGFIPFARTYLPVHHQTSYGQVMTLTGHWPDVANVGAGNLFWSHLLAHSFGVRQSFYEVTYAVTPLVMLLAVAGGVMALWLLWSGRRCRLGVTRLAVVFAGTAVVLSLLPVNSRFGSAWAVVWHLPGASAMRAIDRIGVVSGMCAVLAIAAAASELSNLVSTWSRPVLWRVAILGLLAVAVVEQVNTTRTSYVDRVAQVEFLRSATTPPDGCRAFYVVDTAGVLAYYEYQVDAMLISQKLSIPTINGYSGHFPPGWLLLQPWVPTYPAGVSEWAQVHDLVTGLCRLDLATRRWSAPAPPP